MASNPEERKSIFQQLKEPVDPKVLAEQERTTANRTQRQFEEAQGRLAGLIDDNSTLPCTISSITVNNAKHTRTSFLKRVFDPVLSANHDRPYTLAEALREVSLAADKLHRFDIFHQPISLYVSRPDKSDPSTTPTDLAIDLTVKEKSRYTFKTGTEVGNTEGDVYGQVLARNLFGGAESLAIHASRGTRTRSAYQALFSTPILSNPDLVAELGALGSATDRPWASHEELLSEGWSKLRYTTPAGDRHDFTFSSAWRQATGLRPDASRTVRADAGDSVKNFVGYTFTRDRRDNPYLPRSGTYFKTYTELAGLFGGSISDRSRLRAVQGDVSHAKAELEAQAAAPLPAGASFTASFRSGAVLPLAHFRGGAVRPSLVTDRFQLGGPADVRGFRLAGLGPRDGRDAVGGDVYAAGSANLLVPLPRLGAESPLRFQAFVNGGRLLALKQPKDGAWKDGAEVRESLSETIKDLSRGLPSAAAGIGIVYAHPVARFELNFSLPLVIRKGEEGRKGLQFGVGINLL